jgi:serine-type D-Ala-D-Ala carboxypeptidase/endopeptidase (penicillin-binding protein 4)
MARIALCLTALALAALAPAAQAAGPAATHRALDRQMRFAGAGSSAYVVDLDSDAVLYNRAGDTPRIPASVNKLYTSAAALTRWGPEAQLETEVLGSTTLDELGVLDGNLYLRGGGDPTFGRAEVRRLARILAGRGLTEVTGRVIGDESHFDALRGGPASSFRTSTWVGPLSALAYNRGLTEGRRPTFQTRPALYAAQRFEKALEREGIEVGRAARAGLTPSLAEPMAEWASPRIEVLVGQINRPSDNFMAETLLKALGAEFGTAGSTAAGTAVARDVAAELGASPTMVDGSGLSRANRTSPHDVVDLLAGMDESEAADDFATSLAVAGRSGTLSDRMRRTSAQERCRAKTGTLIGVSALAGYCDGPAGSRVAFSFLMAGLSVTGAHRLQDRMAAVLARYRAAPSR